MYWQASLGPCGDWHWGIRLPSDICVGVSDTSAAQYPEGKTEYRAGVATPTRWIDLGLFQTLAEAKDAALARGLEMSTEERQP